MHMKYVWRPLGLCAVAAAVWLAGGLNANAAPAADAGNTPTVAGHALPGKAVADKDDRKADKQDRKYDRRGDKYDRRDDRRYDGRHDRDRYDHRRDDRDHRRDGRYDKRRDDRRDYDRKHDGRDRTDKRGPRHDGRRPAPMHTL